MKCWMVWFLCLMAYQLFLWNVEEMKKNCIRENELNRDIEEKWNGKDEKSV